MNWTADVGITIKDLGVSSSYDSNNDSIDTFNKTTPRYTYEQYSIPQLRTVDIVTLCLYALIFVLGVVGNLLVIITLIQNKRMRTVTNVFLLNLSISDLLLVVLCMPFTIIPITLMNFIFGEFICISIRYMQAVVVSVSCFTLVAISLERYFAICRPLHSRQWQTLKHSYKTIAVCWFAAFILCIPVVVFTKYKHSPYGNYLCREAWESRELHIAYTILLDFVLLIMPVAIMAVSYGQISYTLWIGMKLDKQELEEQNGHNQIFKSDDKDGFGRVICPSELNDLHKSRKSSTKARFNTRGIRQSNNEKSRASKQRVIKMLFAIVLEFFICWAPLFIVQTWHTIDYQHAVENISPFVHVALFVLSYVSSCCNPITYCLMNKNFRNGFKAAFRCCKCKRGIRARHEMPSYFHYSSARTNCSHVSNYDKVNSKDESDEF